MASIYMLNIIRWFSIGKTYTFCKFCMEVCFDAEYWTVLVCISTALFPLAWILALLLLLVVVFPLDLFQYEPRHDKINKMSVRPAKTQISPVWSESSLCAQWVAKDPSFLHADSEYSDQTGLMPRLIWVFAGCTAILLVLSCSFILRFTTSRIVLSAGYGLGLSSVN